MPNEMEPDNGDDVLEKVDALLKKHQNRSFTPPARAAAPPKRAERTDDDDIPTLTDIVDTAPPDASGTHYAGTPLDFAADVMRHDLEARLYRELESRIAPQLSVAFGRMLDELLEQAKGQISETVRQHIAQELNKSPQHKNPGDETQV